VRNGLSVLAGGLATRASGTGSIIPLAVTRVSDPAADGNETSVDFSNVAATPLARISAYRVNATSWGLKLYSSVTGALQGTPAIIVGSTANANDVTVSGRTILGGSIATAASFFSFLDTAFAGSKGIKVGNLVASSSYSDAAPTNGIFSAGDIQVGGTSAINPAPAPATPTAQRYYRENVPRAWGYVSAAGPLMWGFNVSSVTRTSAGQYSIQLANGVTTTTVVALTVGAGGGNTTCCAYRSGANIIVNILTAGAYSDVDFQFVVFG